ncbi:MAG: CAP domain-containing protein, partial [Chloroflexi bacterium]|nr:CAP domain-containing protein [Chloroflexota bacterium]
SPARTPTPPAELTRLESGEALLQLGNAVRCEAGLTPVALSEPLSEAAYRHSTDMALNAFFDHAGSDGSDVGTRAADAGYSWRAVGENIAAGVADARTVHALWMDSPHHRDNILNGRYTAMGVGHVLAPDTEYGHYWTQVFGTTGEEPGTCEQ